MTHLSDEQLVEAVEGTLGARRATHAATCASCAEKLEATRRLLRELAGADVPEPSPLFWQGFAARVSAAIDQPEPRSTRAWFSRGAPLYGAPVKPVWRWAASAFVVALLAVGLHLASNDPPPQNASAVTQQEGSVAGPDSATPLDSPDIDTDEAWAVVRSLAADLHVDDARDAGVMPRPGSIERAATELSEAERAELVKLLEDEMKRIGA